MLLFAVYLSTELSYPQWMYWALFLTPDIGFIGYTMNAKVGAFTYNFLHHKGVAIAIYLLGLYFYAEPFQFAGLLLFGHSSFDRVLGYGLKFEDSFQHTHLGWIGKTNNGK
jgi:hypothetical protein